MHFKLSFPIIASCVLLFISRANSQATKLSTANNNFSLDLYQKLASSDGNIFASPFSASVVLSMLLVGAQGDTAKELQDTLGYTAAGLANNDMENYYHDLLSELRKDHAGYEFEIANSMWLQANASVLPDFKKTVKDKFYAEEESVNFGTKEATDTINKWVDQQTKGKIRTLFDKPLDSLTVLVLVNAMYFKGTWVKQFNVNDTSNMPFYNNGQATGKSVPTMKIKENFLYSKDDDLKSQIIELPYQGNDVSMFIVLPSKGVALSSLENQLTYSKLNKSIGNMETSKVEVHLPKFKLEDTLKLKDALVALGVDLAFSTGANLRGISQNDALYVSQVQQKAVINVDEKGSEAAVATAAVVSTKSLPAKRDYEVFNADHPFLFFIQHKPSGTVLFTGRVQQF